MARYPFPNGRVCVAWDRQHVDEGVKLVLEWRELGGPPSGGQCFIRLWHQPDTRSDPSRARRGGRSRIRAGRGELQNRDYPRANMNYDIMTCRKPAISRPKRHYSWCGDFNDLIEL